MARALSLNKSMERHSLPQFTRYEIESTLGQGGMGMVYKARHTLLDRTVALKVPHSRLLQNDVSRERFIREARALARLEHPHVVSVYDADLENGYPYIAMKFVEGHTLTEHIYRSTPPEVKKIIEWITQMAEALDYVHGMGILHRDLKSSNVLISSDGKALITDFGLVQMETEATITNGMLGTPAYMSPEQAMGRKLDVRSDIYSLGVILYEALTGMAPFREENTLALIQQIIHSKPVHVRTLKSDIPPWLADITHQCLQKKPGHRFQSCAELIERLKKVDAMDRRQTWAGDTLPGDAASPDHFSKTVRKALIPINDSIARFVESAVEVSPVLSRINQKTGLLKTSRWQINPGDLIRDPFAIGIVVLWALMSFPLPRGHATDSSDPILEAPVENDSTDAGQKSRGWQPW